MKKLLFILFVSVALNISAQTTETVIYLKFGSNPSAEGDANAIRTIEVGDTVRWYFYSNAVIMSLGRSQPSVEVSSGAFWEAGFHFFSYIYNCRSNPFVCEPHGLQDLCSAQLQLWRKAH